MNIFQHMIILGLGLLSHSQALAAIMVIESTFDTDLDGWTKAPGSDAGSTLTWISSGGNPGGFLRWNEAAQGSTDRVAAPSKFLGDLTNFIGGTFEMDRITNTLTNPVSAPDDIRLVGGGHTLRYDLPSPGLTEWTHAIVDLKHDAGWVHVTSGLAPTSSEFAAVMSDLTGILLLADFRSGPETPSFDNIRMTSIPEPSSVMMLLSGCVGLVCWRRRG